MSELLRMWQAGIPYRKLVKMYKLPRRVLYRRIQNEIKEFEKEIYDGKAIK